MIYERILARTRTMWVLNYAREYAKRGIKLPVFGDLPNFGKHGELIILQKLISVIVLGKYSYTFKPGFICDLGSVPKFFRSVVDNDDYRLLLAFFVHDANFGCHFLSFRASNRVLWEMAKLRDYPWPRRVLMWLSVASLVGLLKYRKQGRHEYMSKTVDFKHVTGG